MENDKNKLLEKGQINQAMRLACKSSFGVLDQGFLCQPVSLLNPHEPICVSPDSTLIDVWQAFRQHKIGCVLVTDKSSRLIGIFSERDLVLKVEPEVLCKEGCKVEEMMTPEPQCCAGDDPIAYALNLMSQGGFRHLPLVDQDHVPIGIISVKDVVDYLVGSFVSDVLNFEIEE